MIACDCYSKGWLGSGEGIGAGDVDLAAVICGTVSCNNEGPRYPRYGQQGDDYIPGFPSDIPRQEDRQAAIQRFEAEEPEVAKQRLYGLQTMFDCQKEAENREFMGDEDKAGAGAGAGAGEGEGGSEGEKEDKEEVRLMNQKMRLMIFSTFLIEPFNIKYTLITRNTNHYEVSCIGSGKSRHRI